MQAKQFSAKDFYSHSNARQLLFIEGGTILQSHLIAVVSVQ